MNASRAEFSVTGDRIQFGLSAIKGCSSNAAEAIAAERDRRGPYRDLFDLCIRVDPTQCGRSSLEALIRAGAMDCFGGRRSQWMAVLEKALQGGAASAKDKRTGQMSLFDELAPAEEQLVPSLPDIPEFPEKEKLAMEKEVLGYYLSSHPLAEFESLLKTFCSHTAATARSLKNRTEVMMGGVISSIKLAHTRNPKPGQPSKYANFDLEDLEGIVRSIAWPTTYDQYAEFVQPDSIVLIRGRIDKRGEEEINLICDEIIPIQAADEKYTSGIHIFFDASRHREDMIPSIEEILRGYPGEREVVFSVTLAHGEVVHIKSAKRRVHIHAELRQRLDDLLGDRSHRLLFTKPKLNTNSGKGDSFRRRNAN